METAGGLVGAVEVVAGFVTDWDSCRTELFSFLLMLAGLPMVWFVVEVDMLLLRQFTNWQL